MAGTSTGGILAAALTGPRARAAGGRGPRYAARDLLGLYEAEGPEIFDRSLLKRIRSVDGLLDERYDDAGLEAALRRYLDGTRLSDALTDVLITAYEIERREAFFFRSARARADPTYDFTLADACRATAAAPTYFEPARVGDLAGEPRYALVDGGVFATNPVLCARRRRRPRGPARRGRARPVARHGLADPAACPYERVRGLGRAGVGAPDRRRRLRRGRRHDGLRGARRSWGRTATCGSRPTCGVASDALDDASPRNMAALREEGARLLRDNAAAVDALAERLSQPAAPPPAARPRPDAGTPT